MLFTSKLETTDGNSISQTKVKALLKNIIANENKMKPLSDQKNSRLFRGEKRDYHFKTEQLVNTEKNLNIPSSAMRKEI